MTYQERKSITDYKRCSQYVLDGEYCNGILQLKDLCAYHYQKRNKNLGSRAKRNMSKSMVREILNLYSSGLSSNQVAIKLGISKPTVLRYARKNGIDRPHEKSQGVKYIYGFDHVPKTPWHRRLNTNKRYIEFRKEMFKRDRWRCVECGYRGSKIQLDHIKPKSLFPELTYEPTNVRTLCIDCHRQTDTYGTRVFKYVMENK